LKTQKNEENTSHIFYSINYIGSHIKIPSYKMSSDKHECILIHSFELNHTALLTNKFQLIEEHDQAQKIILEMHSRSSHLYS